MYDDQIEEVKRCVLLFLISERGWKLGGNYRVYHYPR